MDDIDKIIEDNKDNPEALAEKLREFNSVVVETKQKLTESEEARKFQGQNFKKFRDMTSSEKELLSEKEKEIMIRQEKLEEEQKSFLETQQQSKEREVKATESRLALELVGGDQALQDKLFFHYNRIADKAETQEEIARKMQDAYAILARDIPTVDPLRRSSSYRTGGGSPDRAGGGGDKHFSDTDEGKGLANAMGIVIEPPAK